MISNNIISTKNFLVFFALLLNANAFAQIEKQQPFNDTLIPVHDPVSTYKMMVGRSEKIFGPYVDRDGVPMNLGGGSLLLEGNKKWYGVGHNAVAAFNGYDYLVYDAYDANDNGKSKLQIKKIVWFQDWPLVAK